MPQPLVGTRPDRGRRLGVALGADPHCRGGRPRRHEEDYRPCGLPPKGAVVPPHRLRYLERGEDSRRHAVRLRTARGLPQEFRPGEPVVLPIHREKVHHLHPQRQRKTDRTAPGHLRGAGRIDYLHPRAEDAARGVRRQRSEDVLLHRPPDIRPLPQVYPQERTCPLGQTGPLAQGAQPDRGRRLHRARRPRNRPLRRTSSSPTRTTTSSS